MKTKNLIISLLLTTNGFLCAAQNNEVTPVTAEKISENLYQLTGGRGANGGMYIGDNDVFVIDSKMDRTSVEGIFAVAKGLSNKPVTWLINTHSDGDHINGNQFFPQPVTIVAHENCRREFLLPQRDGSPSTWATPEMLPFVPEVTFNDQVILYSGNKTVELYYFGIGHTTGDIVVYFPEEKTAFIGDQVFFERPQLIHSYKGGNSFEHVKTTENMLAVLDAEKFCSGHSGIKTRADVEKHLTEIKAMQQKVKQHVTEGKTLEESQKNFSENEARLVESIYNELKAM